MTEGPLHISRPGLLEALCDLEAMAVWECLRSSAGGRSLEEAAAACDLSQPKTRTLLDWLVQLGLVERRPAGRGRRLPTFRVTVPELRVAYDGIEPDRLAELFARWHASRVEQFELMLAHKPTQRGRRPRGFCGSGSARLNADERGRLGLLIQQIGNLMRNAAMRQADGPRGADEDSRIYAVLLRTEELATEPPRQPNILFVAEGPDRAASPRGIDRGLLSPRERQIAEALAAGSSRPEIARQLGLSPHTVVTLSKRIYRKLAIRRRAELARIINR